MLQIILDAEAGQVSAELARRRIAAAERVHVVVEIGDPHEPPMAAIDQAGKVLDWLAEEPDLYSDADLRERAGWVFAFGSIVLTRLPFTDLSGDKRRPALVVSRNNDRRLDVFVCFITSIPRMGPDMAALAALSGTGLKVPSVVHFDKIALLDRSIIMGKPGDAPSDWVAAQRAMFFGTVGFDIS